MKTTTQTECPFTVGAHIVATRPSQFLMYRPGLKARVRDASPVCLGTWALYVLTEEGALWTVLSDNWKLDN